MKVLFVGGSLDGQRREVADRVLSSGVVFVPVVETRLAGPDGFPQRRDVVQREQYVLHRIAGSDQLFEVFVPAHWTDTDTIAALIRGYRP